MKTAIPLKLNTPADAVAFFNELVKNGEDFHPDDGAAEMYTYDMDTKGMGERTFTDDEAEDIESLLEEVRAMGLDPATLMWEAVLANNPDIAKEHE
jgi:hypothetical protein